MMIALQSKHLSIVKAILHQYLPDRKVGVFGSRATHSEKPWSDLDLCVMGDKALTLTELAMLREAFSESDLPVRVDIVDWASATPAFQDIIRSSMVMLDKKV